MPLSRKRRLPLVPEADASGRTLEIYREIKDALGLPHVNVLFQAYGTHPKFLELHWKHMRPAVETLEFFRVGKRLQAEAYTRVHNYLAVPDLGERISEGHFPEGARQELANVVELFHYNNPLLLLISAAQLQAFEEIPSNNGNLAGPAIHPVFSEKPVLVTEEPAPAPIGKIYDDIKRTLGLGFISPDYQALAHWPDFFAFYWSALKSAVASPLYAENKHAMRESALSLAGELSPAPQLSVEEMQEAGLANDEISSAIHITEEFLDLLSGLIMNIAFVKISLEGGNQMRILKQRERAA